MPFVLNTPLIFQHPQTYSETVFLIHFPQVVAAVTLLSDLEVSAITGRIYGVYVQLMVFVYLV